MEWKSNRCLFLKPSSSSELTPGSVNETGGVNNPSDPIESEVRQDSFRDATDGEVVERKQELERLEDDFSAQLYPFSEQETREIEEFIGALDLDGMSFDYRNHVGRGPAFTGEKMGQKPEFSVEENKLILGMVVLKRLVNEEGEHTYDVCIFSKYEDSPKESGISLSFTDRQEAIRATFALDFIMRQNVASNDKMGVSVSEDGERSSRGLADSFMMANPNTNTPVMLHIPPKEKYKAEPYQVEDGRIVFKNQLYYVQVAPDYEEVSSLCSPDVLEQMASLLNKEFQGQLKERQRWLSSQYES